MFVIFQVLYRVNYERPYISLNKWICVVSYIKTNIKLSNLQMICKHVPDLICYNVVVP